MPTKDVSILNDALGPIMRGPSSSHTAASVRIGLLMRALNGDTTPSGVVVDYDEKGSLATTADSQGSNIGLCAGLMGWTSSDERVCEAQTLLSASGATFTTTVTPISENDHPNTYRIHSKGNSHWVIALSTGGGAISVVSVDNVTLNSRGDRYIKLYYVHEDAADELMAHLQVHAIPKGWIGVEKLAGSVQYERGCETQHRIVAVDSDKDFFSDMPPLPGSITILSEANLPCVMPVPRPAVVNLPFTTVREMRSFVESNPTTEWTLPLLALQYEAGRSGLSHETILERVGELVDIYESSVVAGLKGTSYEDRILGPQSLGYQERKEAGALLDLGLNDMIIAYATSFMEMKSSFGLIIGAPTAGSCGVLPGCLIAAKHSPTMQKSRTEIVEALLACGLIGVFIATRSTFAAEEGGCQAECGAAGSMAAAGLTYLKGGTIQQCITAASMVIQSVLGMACDPIANRVEAPCLLRNVVAATMACSSTNMSLSGYSAVIPYDEVLAAHWEVCLMMPRQLRCTGLGGLAAQPSARVLEQKCSIGGCGGCGGGGGSMLPPASDIW